MSAAPVADRKLLVASEVALVAVTASIVGGFGRLFVDASFLPEVATMAAISHGLALIVRRMGRGILLSVAVSLVGLLVTTTLLFYADTTSVGLPTWATRDAARADLSEAWRLFGEVRAPAPVHVGFVLGAGVAVWLVAFLADWAAFRLWSPVEAVAPAGIVFLFCSLQRAEDHQAISTAAFAATVLVFVLLHRVARQDSGASWLATDPAKGRSAIVRVGSVVGAAAIVTGLVVGPALPGAGEDAVVPWRDIGKADEDNSRVTVSPLVTIRDRLVTQANVEAFVVVSERPDYWRLTALDRFDGEAWTSSGRYKSADDELPTSLPDGTVTSIVRQQFTILGLDSLWLPAAYEPRAVIDDGGLDPSYEPESGTLTVGDDLTSADGATYVIESRIPQRDVNAIALAGDSLPDDVRDRYTQLPPGFSSRVIGEAQRVTAGAATPYEKAIALQQYFREGFEYSLQVQNGHGTDAIENFLFETRTGYCEQFAGSYAAMARAIGLPARVAVGFTPGDLDEEGRFRVMGRNAHAWPEVYLDGVGWLRFEPTPGRGAPDDQSYTGVPPEQAAPVGGGTATVPTPTTPSGDPTGVLPPDLAGVDVPIPEFTDAVGPTTGEVSTDSGGSSLASFLPLFAIPVVLGGLILGAVPVLKTVRRNRKRARLRASARGRIDAAWQEALDALGLLDIPVDPAATPQELADRVARLLGSDAAPAFADLAAITTASRFAPEEPDPEAQARADGTARHIRTTIAQRVSWKRRLRYAFDPRPLWPGNQLA